MRKIASSILIILAMSLPTACGKSKAGIESCRNECLGTNRGRAQKCGADQACIREAIRSLNACYAKCEAK